MVMQIQQKKSKSTGNQRRRFADSQNKNRTKSHDRYWLNNRERTGHVPFFDCTQKI